MTHLTQYDDRAPFAERTRYDVWPDIAAALAPSGATLEKWQTGAAVSADADDAAILSAYASDIDRLKARGGYRSADVLRMAPDHPDRVALRAKFLEEHIHDDDEVRFFVEGSGLFYIRADSTVHALQCTAGDLIILPAGIPHWFDAGARPDFTVIRLFVSPEGWVARYTGDDIAGSIPRDQEAL